MIQRAHPLDDVTSQIADRIVRAIRPWRIVLFGSRARGNPHTYSDYDIFVDAPTFIGDHFKILDFQVANVPHHIVFSDSNLSMIDAQVTLLVARAGWKPLYDSM